ncbi:diacylglycerol kinase family protein [Janibacter sp. GXQ6167]|uniref:diacylglycerol/lipid kinase family protein n=1 Tax=Janibacter sp. GXQ6167 TaxID=3240791 RepID=UPI003523924D
MRRAILVVNPVAGGGRAMRERASVVEALGGAGWSVEEVIAQSPEHATSIAAGAGLGDVVVSLGGDGLLGLVVKGAVRSGCAVAPLPAGRGNDFARFVGITADAATAAAGLASAAERVVDVGWVGETPFLGVVTIGYDSLANTLANEASFMRGSLVYVVGGVRALMKTRPTPITLTVDGEDHELSAWNVAIGNSGRYGGGLHAAPDARLDDGLLDVVVADGAMSRTRFVGYLVRLLAGRHLGYRGVRTWQAQAVRVSSTERLVVFADGDPVGTLPVDLTVSRAALRILA